ncbi:MAG: SusD/RagB family nutrient-binding outer membrane lipoprotein [Chitinophagaceae bacterium]
MKLEIKNILTISLVCWIAISSCSKKLDEVYLNPNAAIRQPVEQVLPAMIGTIIGNSHAAANSFGIAGDGLNIGRYIQFWGSYLSTQTDNIGTHYDKMGGTVGASDNMGNLWGMFYFSHGANLTRMMEWSAEEQKWDFLGAALALRAWGMYEVTNQYGEIILRDAFNPALQQFPYQSQEEVYDSVKAVCNRALYYLSLTGGAMNPTTFAASDNFLNKGNLDKWKKFVYGILARLYSVLHNKGSYNADSVIKYTDLSCTTNSDNIMASFQNTGITGTKNFFGTGRTNINQGSSGYRQSKFIADLVTGGNAYAFTGVTDPRAWYMLRGNPNGTIKGYSPSWSSAINPSLVTADLPESFVGTAFASTGYTPIAGLLLTNGTAGKFIFRDEAEFPVMTASEMQFIKAEALIRKANYAAAKIAFENAISMHFDMLANNYNVNIPAGKDINAGNKAAYLAAVVPASPNASNMTLTKVMLQKYIAMWGWGFQEVWADIRRYHYSDNDPATGLPVYADFRVPTGVDLFSAPNGTGGSNNGKLVYRARPRYNSEYLYNIPALLGLGAYPPGNDYHTKRIWFCEP